jgi:chemotaxis protein methyltransferase WspC
VTTAIIENVVRERLGLDPAALGPNVLERAVETRMAARGLTDLATYATRLITEQTERESLASDLAVSETWFFRGGRALFERLAAFVADRAASRSPGLVRILSVPCSSGEEPYSLTIALHERFLTSDHYNIDALDISARALAKASAAKYGAFAFREAGTDVRPAYFRPVDDGWEFHPHLRNAIRFLQGNLAEPIFLTGERPYDLILCRNLFIYLTAEARHRAMTNLDRLLATDGRLCVTPAEADRLPPGRFILDGSTEFGIYRRVGVDSGFFKLPKSNRAAESNTASVISNAPPTKTPTPVGTLDAARLLADAGRLDEARLACEQLLTASPSDADALALLGVIHLAAGRESEAFESFRKALYLMPEHVEAMSHMMVLCDRRGDTNRAAALRRRLARVASEEKA